MKDLPSLLGSAYRKSRRLYEHSTSPKQTSLDSGSSSTPASNDPVDPEADVPNPFLGYYDGYLWPDVYTEVMECLEACALIYPLAEMRRLARANKLHDSERLLQIPLSHTQVLDAIEANEHEFSSTKFADDFYVDLLKSRSERSYRESDDLDSYTEYEEITADLNDEAISIIAFNDEHETDELVYSIEVDHDRKRVTVCFRGSVNKADWATDLEIYMAEMPNPLKKYKTQDATVRVHNGFYKSMFSGGTEGRSPQLSAYHEILQLHVLPALCRHRGYKLYVTGHSLGAALASLFGFRVSAEPDARIPKPVTVVSIASPYVGDHSWRSAHQLLEGLGKLRHLRVSSSKDVVPLHPKVSFRWQFYDRRSHVGSLFKHVGMNIRLLEEHGKFDVSYPKVLPLTENGTGTNYVSVSNLFDAFLDELSRGWLQTWPANFCWNPVDYLTWPAHRLRDYHRRLRSCRRRLSNTKLDDLYSRRILVGDLVLRSKALVPERRTKTHVIFLAAPPTTQ